MAVGSVAVLLAVAGLALVDGWQRRRREWGWLALLVMGEVVLDVVLLRGIDTRSSFSRLPIIDVLAVIVLLLMAVHVVGPHLPIATRFGWSLHSPEWEFDGRLFRLNEAARAVVKSPVVDAERARTELSSITGKIASLRPPDRHWAMVRDGWVEAWERYAGLLSAPAGEAMWDEALALQRDLIERTEGLRARYRADASRTLDDRR